MPMYVCVCFRVKFGQRDNPNVKMKMNILEIPMSAGGLESQMMKGQVEQSL